MPMTQTTPVLVIGLQLPPPPLPARKKQNPLTSKPIGIQYNVVPNKTEKAREAGDKPLLSLSLSAVCIDTQEYEVLRSVCYIEQYTHDMLQLYADDMWRREMTRTTTGSHQLKNRKIRSTKYCCGTIPGWQRARLLIRMNDNAEFFYGTVSIKI